MTERVITAATPTWLLIHKYPPPLGTKMLLLTNARTAAIGHYHPDGGYAAWAPLPKETEEVKQYFENQRPKSLGSLEDRARYQRWRVG